MNKNFEVERKVRLKLFIAVASIVSAIVFAVTDGILFLAAMFVFLVTCSLVYHKIIKKHRTVRVELFNDRMVFGKDVFDVQDIKRINLLDHDLKVVYGKNNAQVRYAFKEGTMEEVCKILRVYSEQNNISLLGSVHADNNENEMVFDLDKFKEFYEKKYSFLTSRDKQKYASLAMFLGTFVLFLEVDSMISVLLPVCITLFFNILWRLMRVGIREKCEEQRQYFGRDTLTVEILDKKNTFEKYSILNQKIEKVLATDYYIEVYGDIDCEIHSSKGIDKMVVECVQIPRCFTNEEQILCFGGNLK